MKACIVLAMNAMALSLVVHHAVALAQPLELVTLNDKGGLLPPEEKSVKEETPKSANAKVPGIAKKASAPVAAEKNSASLVSTSASRTTYVVKAGDTLDKVIALNFADSIVKSEVLKKELMALNPGAFSKGNPKVLLTGVTLKLPVAEQLLGKSAGNMGSTWSGEKASLTLSGYTSYPPVYVNAENSEKRRHWVQYP